jgi:hypothetical protein
MRKAPTAIRRRAGPGLPVLLLLALVPVAVSAAPPGLEESPWARAARPHGIDPALLYAVTLVESRRTVTGGHIAPWPWVLRTPTGGYWFRSRAAAERGLRAVLSRWPARRVDVGAAQVNLGWHAARYEDPYRLLDLEYNLQVAARILAEAIDSTRDPVLGIGRYHHWVSEGRARRYGERVWWTYRNVTFRNGPRDRYRLTLASPRD